MAKCSLNQRRTNQAQLTPPQAEYVEYVCGIFEEINTDAHMLSVGDFIAFYFTDGTIQTPQRCPHTLFVYRGFGSN